MDASGATTTTTTPPHHQHLRRLDSAKSLMALGRKLSRSGFEVGEHFTEQGTTLLSEVRVPTPFSLKIQERTTPYKLPGVV